MWIYACRLVDNPFSIYLISYFYSNALLYFTLLYFTSLCFSLIWHALKRCCCWKQYLYKRPIPNNGNIIGCVFINGRQLLLCIYCGLVFSCRKNGIMPKHVDQKGVLFVPIRYVPSLSPEPRKWPVYSLPVWPFTKSLYQV